MVTMVCIWIKCIHAIEFKVSTEWIYYRVIHGYNAKYMLWHYLTYLNACMKGKVSEKIRKSATDNVISYRNKYFTNFTTCLSEKVPSHMSRTYIDDIKQYNIWS